MAINAGFYANPQGNNPYEVWCVLNEYLGGRVTISVAHNPSPTFFQLTSIPIQNNSW